MAQAQRKSAREQLAEMEAAQARRVAEFEAEERRARDEREEASARARPDAQEKAKKLGWKHWPDEVPKDGATVLAANTADAAPEIFVAHYRNRNVGGAVGGTFYADRFGTMPVEVTCWRDAPEAPPPVPHKLRPGA